MDRECLWRLIRVVLLSLGTIDGLLYLVLDSTLTTLFLAIFSCFLICFIASFFKSGLEVSFLSYVCKVK